MSRSLNRAEILGYLGEAPDLNRTSNGTPVCNLRVATTETWTDDGEQKQKTEWHTIVAWDRLAEVVNEHLEKGSRVYVSGKLETREWEDRDGKTRYTTQINASAGGKVIFLDSDGQSKTRDLDGKEKAERLYGGGEEEQSMFEPDDELPY